jgi:tetratricopeptide (TPR) repeat protein
MSVSKSKKAKTNGAKRSSKKTVRSCKHNQPVEKTNLGDVELTHARRLELSLNKALHEHDYEQACRLADIYIEKYKQNLSYRHLVIIAEVYLQKDLYKKAHDLLMDALRMDATSEAAPEILFWLYHKKGDAEQSNQVLDQLLRDGPEEKRSEYLEWRALRGNTESDQQKVLDTIDEIGRPSPDNPRYHELMFSYLMALCQTNRADEAHKILSEIPVELREKTPNLPIIECQIAKSMGRTQDAIDLYTGVMERWSQLPEARWNRGLCYLERGELERGWADYKCRFDWSGFPSPRVLLDAPAWQGENLDGKNILLWAEQGLGDQILFLTLAINLIKESGATVSILVGDKIVGLVQAWYPEARVLPLHFIDNRDDPRLIGIDYHMPIGDLPSMYLNSEEQVKNRRVRYLRGDSELRASICESMGWGPDQVLIGVCWRSAVVDVSRSSSYLNHKLVEYLKNNLPANVRFVNLQYKLSEKEREFLESNDIYLAEDDFFDDVVSHGKHIAACDYVVSPQTITKQLAGLFDVPTISWGAGGWSFLGRDEYPWYRSVASLKLSHDHSRSSLVYHIGRWLNVALEHNLSERKTGS